MNDDLFSFFTDDKLSAINSMNHGEAVDFLMDKLETETKAIRPANREKIVNMIETSRNHKHLLEGSYNFRLSAIGLKNI
jgi:hypothetical protein